MAPRRPPGAGQQGDPPQPGGAATSARPSPGGGPPARAGRGWLTSRAAVLAVVMCAVALSLAYPMREYIAQRRQIDQLQAQRQILLGQLRHLQREQQRLNDPAYIKQLAMDRLGLCLPGATCYVVVRPGSGGGGAQAAGGAQSPWYERLWRSVKEADQGRPR